MSLSFLISPPRIRMQQGRLVLAKNSRNPDGTKTAAYNKQYYAANAEKICARALKWRQEHKEHSAAYGRAYRAKNKEKIAAKKRAGKA